MHRRARVTVLIRWLHALAVATIGFLAPNAIVAGAESGAAGWGLDQLMRELSQVKRASGTFVERKELAVLTTPLESSGTLLYTAPGRLEKHTLKPKPESLILDDKSLVIEDKSRNRRRTLTLEEHPVIWALVESIRSTLAGDLKSLNRFYRVKLDGEKNRWQLTLQPRESNMLAVVESIAISGSGNLVTSIEVYEARGDRSVMTIRGKAQ
jgi:outer membrane lipoprotein-sorting protein